MIRQNLIDDYFNNQPKPVFEKELCVYEIPEIPFCKADSTCFAVKGINLLKGDFESQPFLESVFDDLYRFLDKNKLRGKDYPIKLQRRDGLEKEEYIIEISDIETKITAGETEGIRRAVIAFEDMLRIGGGNLKVGSVHRKYKIKRRISRCYFSPTSRSIKGGGELDDNVDYYPDGYLNRLMHDGVNGIWIYSDFDSLLISSYIKEFGKGSEKRIEKLNNTIKKCKRYGIDVFLFAIEPIALTNSAVVKKHGDLIRKYPQVAGNRFYEKRGNTVEEEIAFCTFTEFGKRYCEEAMEKLFTLCPELGGYMSITQGERVSSCSTVYSDQEMKWTNTCPWCSKYSKPEILAQKIEIMREGMRKSKTDAEFISWTYEHRLWNDKDIKSYVEKAPEDVVLMQNFEDNGRATQLGKTRCAIDYWLSYAGPSDMFKVTAKTATKLGKTVYAKMQICCSHELASVPYIPVPGIIYEKLTKAKKLGVTGIMGSWYFGNYPCLMSKAAEMLSSDQEYQDKEAFLRELASLYWKHSNVENVVKAWQCFEKAYKSYPINVMFSYYGPSHDGMVWELSLFPKNFSLCRSWQLIDRVDGDRIGECLFAGHTIDEAVTLLKRINKLWGKGCKILSETDEWHNKDNEQISVIKALGLLFDSAGGVVEFYRLRNLLGYGKGDSMRILAKMKAIALKEIENCKQMIPLCESDSRLGYHSEAEGYKFFPEKLRDKIRITEKLLTQDFPIAEKRIKEGLSVLDYYDGVEKCVKHYVAGRTGLDGAKWEYFADKTTKFRLSVSDTLIEIELYAEKKVDFLVCNEFELMFPSTTVVLKNNGDKAVFRDAITHQSVVDNKIIDELNKWQVEDLTANKDTITHLKVTLLKEQVKFIRLPYKMLLATKDGVRWCEDPTPVYTLGKSILSPADFGWII